MKQAYFRRQVSFLLAAFLAAITAIAPAAAQAPPAQPQPDAAQSQPAKPALPPDVADSITRLTSAIETAEKTIQHLAELEEELGGLRVDVETILSDSTQTAETLRPELAAVKSQIEKLGPPPSKDGPPEAPALAAERARLMALAAGLDSAIKSGLVHIEYHPPLRKPETMKYLAGPEIGGGTMTNESDPDEKAAELRAVSSRLAASPVLRSPPVKMPEK